MPGALYPRVAEGAQFALVHTEKKKKNILYKNITKFGTVPTYSTVLHDDSIGQTKNSGKSVDYCLKVGFITLNKKQRVTKDVVYMYLLTNSALHIRVHMRGGGELRGLSQ
jgi:hypothetical protein